MMTTKELLRYIVNIFEPRKRNPIKYGDDQSIDDNLKPIRIGDKNSVLELSDNELRVGSDITIQTGNINSTESITLDAGKDITLDSSTGKFISKYAGTEFSVLNSSYAGMILGFTVDGADSADQTYNLTTSYVVFDNDLSVTFKTPPSEKVEIQATFYYQQANSGYSVFVSIANNSTYGSSDLHHESQHEKAVTITERGGQGIVTVSWYVGAESLEAIGSSNTIYFAAKTDNTTGNPNIKWGGDATDDYQNFVMKAIALPK